MRYVLTGEQIDALNEVGNIGAGKATTALAQMTAARLRLSVPQTRVLPIEDLPLVTEASGAEMLVSVFVGFEGQADGSLLLIFSREETARLLAMLGLEVPASEFELTDLQRSAVSEVGNVLASSYLNALSELTGLLLLPLPPAIGVGMAAAVLGSVAACLGQTDMEGLVIDLRIEAAGDDLGLRLLMIPQRAGLDTIICSLGLTV